MKKLAEQDRQRDVDLTKIQALLEIIHNEYNIDMTSAITAFIGTLAILISISIFNYSSYLGYLLTLIGLLGLYVFFGRLLPDFIEKRYNRKVQVISQAIEKVENGESLPSLNKLMEKIKKKKEK